MEAAMKATIVDLRYRMNDILKALDRNETVTILYHGKKKGILTGLRPPSVSRVQEHPFFNMRPKEGSVEAEMEHLRGVRYRAL
jgi:hypothetical protein